MLTRLHRQLGQAGLIVAIVALIAALTGGAIAATHSATGKATASAKAKRGPRGPKGPTGAVGPQGAKGDPGPAGTNGTNGKNGVSVTTAPASEAECGKAGGVKLTADADSEKVCNGTTGFTKTLPSGETETGTWVVDTPAEGGVYAAISYSIPLAAALDQAHAHYINGETGEEVIYNETTEAEEEVAQSQCLGSIEIPTAKPGNLCVYNGYPFPGLTFNQIVTPGFSPGAGRAGTLLAFHAPASGGTRWGTWAVSAP